MSLSAHLERRSPVDRVQTIIESVKGKNTLHLGCCDYPFHMERYRSGCLLHQRIDSVCESLVGLDVESRALKWLSEREPSWILHYGNIEMPESIEITGKFDVIVATEILEHLGNPSIALRGLRQFLNGAGEIIVTVPNALSLRNFINTAFYRENVHPHHVSWYSPRTLEELMRRSGYEITQLLPYSNRIRRSIWMPYDFLHRLVHHLFVWFAEGLFAIAVPVDMGKEKGVP